MRISDWSSDVCSSDLQVACQLVCYRNLYSCRKDALQDIFRAQIVVRLGEFVWFRLQQHTTFQYSDSMSKVWQSVDLWHVICVTYRCLVLVNQRRSEERRGG